MWEIMEENFNCNECTGNFELPPPKFEIPPPPMPPSLKNYVKCNEEDFVKRINNWDKDICDAIPTFEVNFYTSTLAHTLMLVAVFSLVLILVIILSVIYVRRLMNQKNGGCKELKNLMKHTLNSRNPNLEKLENSESYYDECYRCNEYTIRQAQDFIGYTTTSTSRLPQTHNIRATPTQPLSTSALYNTDDDYFNQFNIDFSGYYNDEPIPRNHYDFQNQYFRNHEYSRTYERFTGPLTATTRTPTPTPTTTTTTASTITEYNSDSGNDNNYPEYVEIELPNFGNIH